ncbi:MAG: hypothetical protein HXX10_07705 [Rhodoplanes sp.]|uniref:hypothetical protein n=1 Tax=Rhodoplanes sp. TaxID=1968906 RepID=UPI001830DC0A|nr:hypothetical protein [Rhodoplanes sp.]NVO13906.1 hypothetical protein [Rhodoplanes sp.]
MSLDLNVTPVTSGAAISSTDYLFGAAGPADPSPQPYTFAAISQYIVRVTAMTGDAGAGGLTGLVPAPAAGDAAAGKFLGAGGAWAVPVTAPLDADYLVRTAQTGLSAERVVTDNAPVTWDWSTPGVVKVNVATMGGDTGTGGTKGLVPAPAAGDAAGSKFLKADGTWTAVVTSIADASITNAKLATMAAHTFKGNNTAAVAAARDLTAAQITAELNAMTGDTGAGGTKGLVPAPAAGDAAATKFLRADGTWAVTAGGAMFSFFKFTASAGQTVFTGTDGNGATLLYTANNVTVIRFGRTLTPGDDYTATNGTSITLASACNTGDPILIYASSVNNQTAAPSAAFAQFTYDCAAGQTAFSGPDKNAATLAYTPNAIEVFLDGRLQMPFNGTDGDYIATNGTSIALISGALAGDSLRVIAWSIVGVSSAVVVDSAQSFSEPQRAQAQVNIGLGLSFRNRLFNGTCAVNQRGVSGTVTLAAGVYGHDRFKAGAGGCTYTFTTVGADTQITITAGTLLQVIEDINVEGGTYTASWVGTATARIYQGAASGSYLAGPQTVLGLTAKTATTIEWSTGTLTDAQFEPGSKATSFERRPFGFELSLCQKYFCKSYAVGTAPGSTISAGSNGIVAPNFSSGGSGFGVTTFPSAPMRVTPTVVVYDGAGTSNKVSYYDGSWKNNGAAGSLISNGPTVFTLNFSSIASCLYQGFDYTASAEL